MQNYHDFVFSLIIIGLNKIILKSQIKKSLNRSSYLLMLDFVLFFTQ